MYRIEAVFCFLRSGFFQLDFRMKTCLIFIFTHGPTTQQLSPLVFDQSHWPFASQLQRGALTTLFGSLAHLIALHFDAFGVYITFDLSVVYSSANRNRFFFGLSCFVHLSPSHSGGMEQPVGHLCSGFDQAHAPSLHSHTTFAVFAFQPKPKNCFEQRTAPHETP